MMFQKEAWRTDRTEQAPTQPGKDARPIKLACRNVWKLFGANAANFIRERDGKASMADVVIFRPFTEDTVSVKQINVKQMWDKRDLSEDPLLRPGDTIYISKSAMGKMQPILSKIGLGLYFNPFQF